MKSAVGSMLVHLIVSVTDPGLLRELVKHDSGCVCKGFLDETGITLAK